MPSYALEGVAVEFPFEAYPCQLDYMSGVIRALKQGTNALLESPTGTGKTLCLLCATLAWRESLRAQDNMRGAAEGMAEAEAADDAGVVDIHGRRERPGAPVSQPQAGTARPPLPPIVYSSRTHSQLAQVMRELRNTSYRPRTAVLSSRAQTCQHAEVSQLSGGAATAACKALTSSRSCQWYNRVDEYVRRNPELNQEPIDIEELVRLGQSGGPCPYYLSKEMATNAELIFVPYNYLIDGRTRRSLGSIDWRNSIVIFDEAHNVESVCADNYSMDITAVSLATAIQEVSRAREIMLMGGADGVVGDQGDASEGGGALAGELKMLGGVLKAFEDKVSDFSVGDTGITRPGEFIFTFLAELNITIETADSVCSKMEQAADVLVEQALSSGSKRGARITNYKIAWLADCLRAIFKTNEMRGGAVAMSQGFRVHIHRQSMKNGRSAPTLSYWCFYPGLSMNDLASCGIRSVLLTSGTLSPLPSLAHELSLPFPIRLENPHVIDPKQVCISVVSKGPSGVPLNSSYQNRDNPRYKTDLGNAIVNFARSTPDGLLVFFPSYGQMQSCIDFWKDAATNGLSIWDRLAMHKHPVIEPRDSATFAVAAATFKAKIDDPASSGAAFFAVCRGKVSEGLDFSDRAGRAVILTGIPYPMKTDPKVRLKQQVLDEEAAKHRRASGGRAPPTLSGSAWYSQQAMRAVNQALGRVIRHRNDYGAVLLCDERFAGQGTRQQLSKWLRDKVATPPTFGAAAATLQKFFREMKANPAFNVQKTAAPLAAAPPAGLPAPVRLPSAEQVKPMDMRGMSQFGSRQLLESLPTAADAAGPPAAPQPAAASKPAAASAGGTSRLLGVLGSAAERSGGGGGSAKAALCLDSLLSKSDPRAQRPPPPEPTQGSRDIVARGAKFAGGGAPSRKPTLWSASEAPVSVPPASRPSVPGGVPAGTGQAPPPSKSGKAPLKGREDAATGTKRAPTAPGKGTDAPATTGATATTDAAAAQGGAAPGTLALRQDNVAPPRPPATKRAPSATAAPSGGPAAAAMSVEERERKRAAAQPKHVREAEEAMARLKRVLLRAQFTALMSKVKAYKSKTLSMVELVDYAVSVIPGAELEASFGLFLSKEGRQMLVDKAARKQRA
eukprot:jgi/Tetstr1/456411/TSEL_043145.t1